MDDFERTLFPEADLENYVKEIIYKDHDNATKEIILKGILNGLDSKAYFMNQIRDEKIAELEEKIERGIK